jgi:cytochrome c biogenesis protein CcmG/thiol:disulfide interchange protein DsbE
MKSKYIWYALPLLSFVGLLWLFKVGLKNDPHNIPTPFVGKKAPDFILPQLSNNKETFSPAQMQGKVWMLNVWASWCESCRQEHSTLLELARTHSTPMVGLDYKDDPQDGLSWITSYGNPYDLIAVDRDGHVGIDYGVYGVPETYVIDQQGIIRDKETGPISEQIWTEKLWPLIQKLQKGEGGQSS